MNNVESKTWTKEEILYMLSKSNLAVMRGVVAIYKEQTPDEKYERFTKHLNGRGFSSVDASFGSGMARRILDEETLSQSQINACRKMIKKYAGQLSRIANG